MQKISVLMVGIGGYGSFYLRELLNVPRAKQFQIVGAVDPYTEKSEYKETLQRRGIPIYNTLEEFYQMKTAEMAIIATPIHLHAHQAIYCMEHGSDVLCEKPACVTVEDATAMITARNRTGRKLAIGFQWSFSESILQLKRDIMSGLYGNICRIRTLAFFPRNLDYYHRGTGWAGKRRLASGEWLLDSVASNATAHYLHNMLFLTGVRMDRSAEPAEMSAEIYRANPIEMFDTCALCIRTMNDIELLFYATHAISKEHARRPEFIIEGEEGTVTLRQVNGKEVMIGCLNDGHVINYEAPSSDLARKIYCMGKAIRENESLPCIPETTLPHLKCICRLAESFLETPRFPEKYIHFSKAEHQYICKGLAEDLEHCWREGTLPYEEKLGWAQKPHDILM